MTSPVIGGSAAAPAEQEGLQVAAMARALDLPVLHMSELLSWAPDFSRLPFTSCAIWRCAAVRDPQELPHLLLTDPYDVDRMAWARTALGPCRHALVSESTLEAWLVHCEAGMSALGAMQMVGEEGTSRRGTAEVLSMLQIGIDESPAVRFVNSTLYDALKSGASDTHLESDAAGLAIKFRIDGVLNTIRRVDSVELAAQAISRIKVMAQLDIAERRVPQDGRLQIHFDGRSIDVRVSIMPSIHGEDAVLRILDRQHLAKSLEGLTLGRLGFTEHVIAATHRLARKPHGMLLVTGPTGSGKTTTLYATIAETHHPRDKIITIEDPVEYQLPGVLQIPVNDRKGLTFARGLRSILRHDPDKILVGEIRDAETAQIAVQSALTGHLVFTTVHANNVFDVVGRFVQFEIDAYTFSSAISGILAQRLFRKICPHCAKPAEGGPELHSLLPPEDVPVRLGTPRWRVASGCEHCRGTGYAGRFALGELLEMTPEIKSLIAARAPLDRLQAAAWNSGWRSLRSLALGAACDGLTTLEEVDRVAV